MTWRCAASRDQSGYFFYSQRHPLAPEPELRYAVHNRRTYVSPDVEAFAEDIPEVHRWAQETLRQAMALAHELGMKNSVTFEPFGYGVPQPYLQKMKEWNGGKPVDPKDRLHPLMREYVLSAHPLHPADLSGPGHPQARFRRRRASIPARMQELRDYIRKLVGGELTDSAGTPCAAAGG